MKLNWRLSMAWKVGLLLGVIGCVDHSIPTGPVTPTVLRPNFLPSAEYLCQQGYYEYCFDSVCEEGFLTAAQCFQINQAMVRLRDSPDFACAQLGNYANGMEFGHDLWYEYKANANASSYLNAFQIGFHDGYFALVPDHQLGVLAHEMSHLLWNSNDDPDSTNPASGEYWEARCMASAGPA